MNKLFFMICASSVLCGGLALSSFTSAQDVYSINAAGFGVEGEIPGLYCEVDKAEVCVIARTEEDCKKIGGVKTESCLSKEDASEE